MKNNTNINKLIKVHLILNNGMINIFHITNVFYSYYFIKTVISTHFPFAKTPYIADIIVSGQQNKGSNNTSSSEDSVFSIYSIICWLLLMYLLLYYF
ncbi:hypothetical protein SGLAD_v1c04060 [Spiroplasma gladiatoris]|uniref:Uncharacterized protein n=1 Tax=Spiroplasma gladiatoris TaxID=2143 RepID=A0A4P7AGS4_9MOLU|nr:hypothetical protein [Spiroplasma gladiatoris]QBQ07605.1 hypothetical protein SGLAD_v1c04060 [Spiroplasma gladiatoris]